MKVHRRQKKRGFRSPFELRVSGLCVRMRQARERQAKLERLDRQRKELVKPTFEQS